MSQLALVVAMLVAAPAQIRAQNGIADIRSIPAGARVLVDGTDRGVTPLLLTLPVGTHRCEVISSAGSRAVLQIAIVENEVSTHEVTLATRPNYRTLAGGSQDDSVSRGKVTVLTEPAGADVAIDGHPSDARSPVTIEEVPAGSHTVTATAYMDRLADRFSITHQVQVDSGRTSVVRIDFEAGTTEGLLRFASNVPDRGIVLRHVASGKRYVLRRPGDHRLVTGMYAFEAGEDSLDVPLLAEPVRVLRDSLTVLYVPRLERLIPLRTIESHRSYLPPEAFLKRTYHPRPLTEVRNEVSMSNAFAWWLGAGVSMVMAGVGTDGPRTNTGALTPDARQQQNFLKGVGVAVLMIGAVASSSVDTVHVDLSYNQTLNRKEEELLRSRYVEMRSGWQRQIDDENVAIGRENARRSAANALVPQVSATYVALPK